MKANTHCGHHPHSSNAYGGIKRALHVLTERRHGSSMAS